MIVKAMNWSRDDIEKALSEFIRNEFGVDDNGFSNRSDLFEDGYVDSIHLESFFGFIEKHFDLVLNEDQFFDERISTISGIAEIILELKGEVPSSLSQTH